MDLLVHLLLFGLLLAMVFTKNENRFIVLFAGIFLFPLGIAFKQSPTIRPMDLFLYGYMFLEVLENPRRVKESLQAIPMKFPLAILFVGHFISTGLNSSFGPKTAYTVFRDFFELYGFLFAAYLTTRNMSLTILAQKLFPLTVLLCAMGIFEVVLQGNYPYTIICSAFPIYTGYYTLDHVISMIQDWRIRTMATTAHPTAFGTLLCCLTLLYAPLWKKNLLEQKRLIIILILLGINLLLCGSRTALMTTIIGIGFFFLRKKPPIVKIFCVGFCIFGFLFYSAVLISQVSNESKGSSISLRQRQMLFTLVQISSSPFFGNGVGSTKDVFEYDDSGRPVNDSEIGGLESVVFRQLIDYGFIGLLCFYLFCLQLFLNFYRSRDKSLAALSGSSIAIASVLFFSLSGLIGNNGGFSFMILGALLGIGQQETRQIEQSKDPVPESESSS